MNLEPIVDNYKKIKVDNLEIGPEVIPDLPLGNQNLDLSEAVNFNELINFLCVGYVNNFIEKLELLDHKMEKNV